MSLLDKNSNKMFIVSELKQKYMSSIHPLLFPGLGSNGFMEPGRDRNPPGQVISPHGKNVYFFFKFDI